MRPSGLVGTGVDPYIIVLSIVAGSRDDVLLAMDMPVEVIADGGLPRTVATLAAGLRPAAVLRAR